MLTLYTVGLVFNIYFAIRVGIILRRRGFMIYSRLKLLLFILTILGLIISSWGFWIYTGIDAELKFLE